MKLKLLDGAFAILIFLIILHELSTVSLQPYARIAIYDSSTAPSMPLPSIGLAPKIVPVSGVVRVLVIAATFSDVNYTTSIDRIKQVWFLTVPAYYREISFGKLTIEGDVYGWYKLPYPQAHYGRNCRSINDADCSGSNQSWHIAEDAVLLAQKNVNFKNYDYYVFIHSGKGQETSHMSGDVWSVTYLDANVRTGSKTISRFNIVPELEEPPYAPNGVWVVEFGHSLGVPDLYNTANGPDNGRPILGIWELMDKGSWNGDPPGSLPAHMTAWAKIQLGFISGTMLAVANPGTTSTYTIDPTEIVSSNVHAVKILLTSNANPKQYYLVEVRMKTGFDAALPVAGVLITYVNENLTIGPVRVMDGDPSVSELEDAVWGVGQTFKDSTLNLAVRVIEKTGNSYRIIISGNSQHSISTRLTDEITPVAKCHNVFTESANSWGNLLIQDYRSIRDQERRRLFPSLFDEMP